MTNQLATTGTFDLAILSRMAIEGNQSARALIVERLAASIEGNLDEILSDASIEETAKWRACQSFAALHDVCDANMLGDTEEIWAALRLMRSGI